MVKVQAWDSVSLSAVLRTCHDRRLGWPVTFLLVRRLLDLVRLGRRPTRRMSKSPCSVTN